MYVKFRVDTRYATDVIQEKPLGGGADPAPQAVVGYVNSVMLAKRQQITTMCFFRAIQRIIGSEVTTYFRRLAIFAIFLSLMTSAYLNVDLTSG